MRRLQGWRQVCRGWKLHIDSYTGPDDHCQRTLRTEIHDLWQSLHRRAIALVQNEAIEPVNLGPHAELTLLSGSTHIDTARAQFHLGSALWLSNKPLETIQAVKLFDTAIRFMTQYEPNNRTLTDTKAIRDVALEALGKFEIEGTLSAWPYWRPPTAR